MKWEPADVHENTDERELRRQPARIVPSVAELREKRNQDRERLVEADEVSGIHVASGSGDLIAPRSRSTRQRTDDALVSPSFFAKMIQILTEAMGPMASLVLKEQIAGLGESPEEFPIIRLPDLMESIKQEILSEGLRVRFEEEIAKQIQEHSKPAAWRSSAL